MVLNDDIKIHNAYLNELFIQKVKARHQTVSLNLKPSAYESSMFSLFRNQDKTVFKTNCVYMNHGLWIFI